MVVESFFMTKSQSHRCYLILSVVLIIIFYCHLSIHLFQMTVKLLRCVIVQSGVIGLIIGFTQIVLFKYVTNTLVFKQGILRLLSESG